MLTNEFLCDIIIHALGICVKVAQQTLTLYVWVRILDPQPKQADLKGRLFVLAEGLYSTQLQIRFRIWIGFVLLRESRCQLASIRLEQKPRLWRES